MKQSFELSASKSLFNRALIIQSYQPNIKLLGQSTSDDVRLMDTAIKNIHAQAEFDCGHAGTVLRFLAFRLSRLKGRYKLYGSKRLFSRPMDELVKLLSQLGSDVELGEDYLQLYTEGWHLRGDGVFVDGRRSSQFATGILLNTWDLDKDFFFQYDPRGVSEAYFRMTSELMQKFGLKFNRQGSEFHIPAGQLPRSYEYQVEGDMSSAFALVALAIFRGPVEINGFSNTALQPDSVFLSLLQQMKIPYAIQADTLQINAAPSYEGIDVDIKNSPDLFPVLAVLCAYAQTKSTIRGIQNLAYKESNRIQKTQQLLEGFGVQVDVSEGEFIIHPLVSKSPDTFLFDPDQDHRMVMAATVAKAAGACVDLTELDSVNKSFPGFQDIYLQLS